MLVYPLQSKPNIKFTTTVAGVICEFVFRTFREMLFVTVSLNGKTVKSSLRACPGQWVIPYDYLKNGLPKEFGNFRFETDGEYPSYKKFGTTCKFCYFNPDDIAELAKYNLA